MASSDPELTIEVHSSGRRVHIALTGDLDLASAPRLSKALQNADASEATEICLDLRELHFIDSSGLREILNANVRLRQNGNRLTIVRGPQRVQRVFEITGTADILPFQDAETLSDSLGSNP